jgi:hypothetical protein
MVLYTCDLCHYKSEYLTRYNEHCMTRKHIRNLDLHEKEINMVLGKKLNKMSTQRQHKVNTMSTQKKHRKLMSVDYVDYHLLQGKVGVVMRKNIARF